jgi:diacylglycerol kinase (ATP)
MWLGTTWLERAFLIATVVLVLALEMLNSALEAAVDRVSLEMHPLAGRAKDMGSAAVLFALLLCGGTWAAALWARFY